MEISLNLHPQFIIENALKMFKLLVEDQDLRHPEFRNHLIFQIQALATSVKLSSAAQERVNECVSTLSESTERLSWLDQGLIAESHERWRLAQAMVHLESAANSLNSNQSLRMRGYLNRVKELFTEVSALKLEKNPSWLALVVFRWRFEPLFRESEYLVKVLDQAR